MSIATRFVSSTARPRLDLSGCVLNALLWRPDLGGSTFRSIGDAGVPSYLCTVNGATYGIQGRTLDGTDDDIDVGNNAAHDITEAITLGGWVKRDVADASHYIAGKVSGGTAGYAIHINASNEFRFVNEGVVDYNSLFQPTTNTWYHLMVTYDRVNVIFYVNGVLEKSIAATAAISTSTENFLIGRRNHATTKNYFDGIIGEVIVFNRALSAQGILQNYQVTKWRYK